MPNDHFQFKQFIVHQDRTAMKVSTDACIQGALAAKFWQEQPVQSLLDIGTGTGLLSLMLAQKLPVAKITAIEIEAAALAQAGDNFALSVWKDQLNIAHSSLQAFKPAGTFDAIICNPPFFHRHLNSAIQQRDLARHDHQLRKEDLAGNVGRLLKNGGTFCVLYPSSEWAAWMNVAKANGWNLSLEVAIRPYANRPVNRMVGFFDKQVPGTVQQRQVTIYEDAGKEYTREFIELMKDYYLYL